MPTVDRKANEKKSALDDLASELLDIDKSKLERIGAGIAFDLLGPKPVRLCITGGAGSGKTTIAGTIAERLSIPCFNFDEYIPGGYVRDAAVYQHRLVDGMSNLWDDLPPNGWIIEHVEACNPDMVKAFNPTHCLLVHPEAPFLLEVARARGKIARDTDRALYDREQRALESALYAKMQYDAVPGKVVSKGKEWTLKATS